MKRYVIGLIVLFSYSTDLCAQTPGDSITIKKMLGSNTFIQDGKALRMKEVLAVMKFNDVAVRDMKKARNNMNWATLFGALGGGFIGWPLGVAIAGADAPWFLAGIGVGLIIVAIPFNTKYNKYSDDAVDHYNATLASRSSFHRAEFKFGFTSNGVGITMNF